MSFTVIETQEQLDAVIKERLDRQASKHSKELAELKAKYEGYLSPDDVTKLKASYEDKVNELNGSISSNADKQKEFETQLAEANKKLSQYQRESMQVRVAMSNGIPYELASRLTGSTEEELTEDAKKLASFVSSTSQVTNQKSPSFNPSQNEVDGVTARFKELNPNLKF